MALRAKSHRKRVTRSVDGPFRRNGSGLKEDRAAAEGLCETCVVGHQDLGLRQAAQQFRQGALGGRIEKRCRFVQYQDLGVHGQDSGDGHAFLLARAEVVGRASGGASIPTVARAAVALLTASAGLAPRFSGPKATSSSTVGMKSWLSES